MARRQKQARSARGKGGFLRGLVLGLAVAAGVQLHHAGLPDWFGGTDDEPAGDASRIEPPKTNFDFYRLLPRKEVRVDDSDLPGGNPSAPGQTAARPSATDGRETATDERETAATPEVRPASPREYRVQVGSFRERRVADRLRAELALGGFESTIQTTDTANGTWHRVMLGPFRGRAAAEAAKARVLTARGIEARIVPEKT